MALYEILSNRPCINILKALYDTEHVFKTAHAMQIQEIEQNTGFQLKGSYAVLLLQQDGLVSLETVENNTILSLTNKGKQFIETIDQLKNILDNKTKQKPQKTLSLEYNLTALEKKILILIYRIGKETGHPITLKNLTVEVYPARDPSNKTGAVSRYVTRLEELHLIHKTHEGRQLHIQITDSGKRVVEEQLLETP